jgi:hypothetical protein
MASCQRSTRSQDLSVEWSGDNTGILGGSRNIKGLRWAWQSYQKILSREHHGPEGGHPWTASQGQKTRVFNLLFLYFLPKFVPNMDII